MGTPHQEENAARDIQSGTWRARLEEVRTQADSWRARAQLAEQALAAICARLGKPPSPPPPEFALAHKSGQMRRFQAVTLPGGQTVVRYRDGAGDSVEQDWQSVSRHFS